MSPWDRLQGLGGHLLGPGLRASLPWVLGVEFFLNQFHGSHPLPLAAPSLQEIRKGWETGQQVTLGVGWG